MYRAPFARRATRRPPLAILVGGILVGLAVQAFVLQSLAAPAPQVPATQESAPREDEQGESGGAAEQQVTAPEPLDADQLRSRASELVDMLDAPQLAHRQRAERELIALGPETLALLPEPDARFSAEAQQRLRRVRRALEQARAEAAVDASVIRLGTVMTVDEALTRLSDQSGIPLVMEPELNAPLSLSLPPMPFWATLDAVLDAGNLDVNYYVGEPGELGITRRGEGARSRTDSAAYAGVYRLESTAVTARRDFRNPALNRLSVELEVAWEPRLTPIGLNLPLDSVVATLEDGQRLTPEAGQIDIAANSAIPFSQLFVPLPLPEGSPRRIATLSGTLRSMLPGAREEFAIPLDQPHSPETVGNLTVLLEEVRRNGELHEVRLEVQFADAGNAFESHRQWVFDNPAYVILADDTRKEHLGYQVYRQGADRVGIGYLFDLGDSTDGMKLHYESPVSIIQDEVDFVMKDVLLP